MHGFGPTGVGGEDPFSFLLDGVTPGCREAVQYHLAQIGVGQGDGAGPFQHDQSSDELTLLVRQPLLPTAAGGEKQQ